MKNLVKKMTSLSLIAVLICSFAGTAFAAGTSSINVPKSASAVFGAYIKKTDKILYARELITDEQTLIQRAKSRICDTANIPAISMAGAIDNQIVGYTTQKVLERVTEDGTHIESARATVILSAYGGNTSPGNASGMLYYSLHVDYELYTCSLWSGYKYKVTGVQGNYISNDSNGYTGIVNWDISLVLPNGGYYLSNGSYNASAHPTYNFTVVAGYNPYPGDTLIMTYQNMVSQINSYGSYCYSTTRISLGISTKQGNLYSVIISL